MIFFRKKKPEPPPKPAAPKKAQPSAPVKEPKAVRSLESVVHTRVLTAEGWRRSMEKKVPKKTK